MNYAPNNIDAYTKSDKSGLVEKVETEGDSVNKSLIIN
jgi:hypothetical protein